MGLFVNNQGQRTELQTKVAADLQDRLKTKTAIEADKTDPAFLDNTNQTRIAGPIIALLLAVTVIAAVFVLSVR